VITEEESPTDEPKQASRAGATSSVDNPCKERRRRTSLFSGTDESGWDDSG